jgi:hypothetical protein
MAGCMYAEAIRERKGEGEQMGTDGKKKGRSNIYAPIISKPVTSFCQTRHIPWSTRSQAHAQVTLGSYRGQKWMS